jgi:hypothetical protein
MVPSASDTLSAAAARQPVRLLFIGTVRHERDTNAEAVAAGIEEESKTVAEASLAAEEAKVSPVAGAISEVDEATPDAPVTCSEVTIKNVATAATGKISQDNLFIIYLFLFQPIP